MAERECSAMYYVGQINFSTRRDDMSFWYLVFCIHTSL
jgi:hypothetical protein